MSTQTIDRDQIASAIDEMRDAATTARGELHADVGEVDFFACKLCGETMYPGLDYTHAETCPLLVLEREIDAFAAAVDTALNGEGEPDTASEEPEA